MSLKFVLLSSLVLLSSCRNDVMVVPMEGEERNRGNVSVE